MVIGEYMWKTIVEHRNLIIGILSVCFIEIVPIKINPIKTLGKLIGKWIGIEKLSTQITAVDKKVDENEIDRIRYEILQFSSSLRRGEEHTENEYQHIEELYKKYHDELHANSYITSEMEYIRTCKNGIKVSQTTLYI